MNDLRNIALFAHHGAGKTTLAEAMLFISGSTGELGRPDRETSTLDFELVEQHRKMSVNLHAGFCEWNGSLVNVLDTPGFPNFLYEMTSALNVVDGAVFLVDANSGIKTPTERLWAEAIEKDIPRLLFMNKLGVEHTNFARSFEEAEKILGVHPAPLNYPIGSQDTYHGVVDLIELKAYEYDAQGARQEVPVPPELEGELATWHDKLMEIVAESDDELLEMYINGEEIEKSRVYEALHKGVLDGSVVPLLVGSATKLIGIDSLLDTICRYFPSPQERKPLQVQDTNGGTTELSASASDPFSALVFKTLSDPYTGKISLMRVFSGTVEADSTVFNSTRDSREKLGHMSRIIGKKLFPVKTAEAGDIVAVNKLKETGTGDTLCDEASKVIITPPELTPAVLSFAIEPKTRGDDDKLMPSLVKIQDENPTLQFMRNSETNEFLISGTGQVHVEVTVEKLRNTYGVDIEMKTPKVPYKETITSSSKAEGKYVKQTGGRGQYGDVWLEIKPTARDSGFEFVNKVVGGSIPKNFIPSVEKGVKEAMTKGVVGGYPVTDLKCIVYDGKHHPVDSSDIAFKIAASMGFKNAMESARSILLEPVMHMEITVPEDNVGDVISDLNSRRGKVSGVMPQPAGHQVRAEVPMAEVLTYAPELRSITSGEGMFNMSFSSYEEVPSHLVEKIVEAARSEDGGKE